MAAPCPFCSLEAGFHDENIHAQIPVPANKLLPTHAAERRARPCDCGAPFDSPANGVCRNPRHPKKAN